MGGDIYVQKLRPDDPEFFIKKVLIENTNYLHDKWRDNKDRMFSKIYFASSLFLTILASFFIKLLSLISILILADILLFLLVLSAFYVFDKQKEKFYSNRIHMKKSFKDYGLKWVD